MPAIADSLRDLHLLHQRAQALRDRIASGPKTLAARQLALAKRQAELDQTKKTLHDAKLQLKKEEHHIQGIDSKIDDLKGKLNLIKKNDEYKALQNQIAHERATKSKVEEEMMVALETIETSTADVARVEADTKRYGDEVAALEKQITEQAAAYKVQLQEFEAAIVAAEAAIPTQFRDNYRRIVARYGADALAACEDRSCRGCYTALTPQMLNDLINAEGLSFCLSCGRLLYMTEPEVANTRRTVKS
jgi:uncharacterized protein